jgi:hypothetical protein
MEVRLEVFTAAKHLVGIIVTVFAFTACSGGTSSSVTPIGRSVTSGTARETMDSNHQLDRSQMLIVPRSVKPNLRRVVKDTKLVKPNCCALQKTLFISDADGAPSFMGTLYMFDYNTGASLGQVADPPEGFNEPQGGCTLSNGDVLFSNTELSTLDEYNHSGTYVQTILEQGQHPIGCAFDKSTGNVAIANIYGPSGSNGNLMFWNGSSLSGPFFPPNMAHIYFLAYEGKTGTLWLDGTDSSGIVHYDSFKNGKFKNVVISGATIGFPGTVAWSAKTHSMIVGDQDTFSAPTFYQVDEGGNVLGSTVTTCTQSSDFCDIPQATIKGPGLVGPDAVLYSANRFAYPAGGLPILNYPAAYVTPIGSAVSPNKGGGGE